MCGLEGGPLPCRAATCYFCTGSLLSASSHPTTLPALQPTISEDAELGPEGDKGKRRTLAGKLLGRGRSKSGKAGGDASSSTGSLDRLAFGSHQLTQQGHRRWVGGWVQMAMRAELVQLTEQAMLLPVAVGSAGRFRCRAAHCSINVGRFVLIPLQAAQRASGGVGG